LIPESDLAMKIKLVGFYDSLFCGGLRKLSSIVKQSYEDTELYLYSPFTLGRRLFYDIKINNFSTLGTVFPNLVTFIFKSKLILLFQGRSNGTVSNVHKNSIGPGQESAVH